MTPRYLQKGFGWKVKSSISIERLEALLSLVKLFKVVLSEFKVNLFEKSQEEILVKSNWYSS